MMSHNLHKQKKWNLFWFWFSFYLIIAIPIYLILNLIYQLVAKQINLEYLYYHFWQGLTYNWWSAWWLFIVFSAIWWGYLLYYLKFRQPKTTEKIDWSNSPSKWLLDETDQQYRANDYKLFNQLYNPNQAGVVVRVNYHHNKPYFNVSSGYHAIIMGATRSGKSQRIILPTAIYNSELPDDKKPTLVFTDPKGELADALVELLKARGYEIKILNLSQPEYSDGWNPLTICYQYFQQSLLLTPKDFANLDLYHHQVDELKSLAYESIGELTDTILPKGDSSNPMWRENARRMLDGTIQAQLDLLEKHFKTNNTLLFNLEQFNLPSLTMMLAQQDEIVKWFKKNDPLLKSSITASQIVNSATVTRQGTFSNLGPGLAIFEDYGLRKMLCRNEIDLFTLCNQPTALFLIVPDEKINRHCLASLFISQLYKASVYVARHSKNQRLPRDLLLLLDEFGNFPMVPGLDSMITVARSRGIYFTLVLQAFHQLTEKYGQNIQKIIKGNCGLNIYLHTNDQETAEEYSQLCGSKEVIERSISVNQGTNAKGKNQSISMHRTLKPLISATELMHISSDAGIIFLSKEQPSRVKMAYFYQFAHLYDYKQYQPETKPYFDFFKTAFFNLLAHDELISTNKSEGNKKTSALETKKEKNYEQTSIDLDDASETEQDEELSEIKAKLKKLKEGRFKE